MTEVTQELDSHHESRVIEVNLPSSKSISQRDLALAAVYVNFHSKEADGGADKSLALGIALKGITLCDDVVEMIGALKSLGYGIEVDEEDDFSATVIIRGKSPLATQCQIALGLSGIAARFVLALATLEEELNHENVSIEITGKAPLKRRPLADLVGALREAGVEISCLENEGHLPLRLNSALPWCEEIRLNGDVSSQYFSALIIIALSGKLNKIASNGEIVSFPYLELTLGEINRLFGLSPRLEIKADGSAMIDMTESNFLFAQQGDRLSDKDNVDSAKSQGALTPRLLKEVQIESDISAASYFMALAALKGMRLKLKHVSLASKQGDIRFVEVFQRLGGQVREEADGLLIEHQGFASFTELPEVDFSLMPDVALTLMAIAPLIPGNTKLTGLHTLRIKECDRIDAGAAALRELGVGCLTTPDTMTIPYCAALASKVRSRYDTMAVIKTEHDHRVCMAFAVLGTTLRLSFDDPSVVSKTFPNFFNVLQNIVAD